MFIIVLSGVLNALLDVFGEDVVGVMMGEKMHRDTEAMTSKRSKTSVRD